MDEKEQVGVSLVPARKRGQKKTPEELRAELDKKIANATSKAQAAFDKSQRKKNSVKNKKAANRNTVRREIVNAVRQAAHNANLPFNNADIKVPVKGAKKEKILDYFKRAKASYYKRTKTASSLQRNAERIAHNEGLNMKYVKATTRTKTVNNVLKRARKEAGKNTTRRQKKDVRGRAIALLLQSDLGYGSESAVMKSICVREKKKAVV